MFPVQPYINAYKIDEFRYLERFGVRHRSGKIGYETCAYIGIYLKDPESFDAVTKALEAIPEVVECHFTTGKYDMFIKLYARNNHHLLSIIHDKLQPLGLARTETLISFHEAIKRQMPIMVEMDED